MKLRPYQEQAVDAVMRQWQDCASTLLVLPTGCGKTIVFADIIRRMSGTRAMVIAHREELIFQAQQKIRAVTGRDVQVEMGEYRADADSLMGPPVIVSTVQTQTAGGDGGGRMSKFNPHEFGLLVIDEAHHATAATYRRVIDFYRQNPKLRVLGVTATPDRADEEALGQVYESVAFDYEIMDAIEHGWLVPIQQQLVEVAGLDYSSIRTTAGDLNGGELAAVMEYEKNLHGIADPTVQIVGDRRALVFAASVAHAERLAEIFCRHRPGCAGWVCGKTDRDERRKVLADFAAGKLQYVVNVGCLTEGFDDSGVEVIVMGRPTKSRSLYAQMVGRATRPAEDIAHELNDADDDGARRVMIDTSRKPHCLVVDFCGNAGKHKLCTSADILGGNVSDEAKEMALRSVRQGGKPCDMAQEMAAAAREIERRQQAAAAQRARLVAHAKFTACAISPFSVLDLRPSIERGWDCGRTLSEKQRTVLQKQGIDPDSMPYHEAKQVLTELFRRWDRGMASYRQARVLKREGFTAPLRRDEASRILDRVAQIRGWKKTA